MSVTRVLNANLDGVEYQSVWTWCPGCKSLHPWSVAKPGHPAPDRPTWEWDGNEDAPTFSPSLLCHMSVHLCAGEHDPVPCPDPEGCGRGGHAIGYVIDGVLTFAFPDGLPDDAGDGVLCHGQPHTREPAYGSCHSFLRNGVWEFLDDCAHELRGPHPMVPLPGWCSE